ncbi:hypothetical protein Mal4_57190 [Maioricimonas rarisocia]|uniref:DUF962 domain-containing protein n=1 Tax=Maioricimonas rarisocia TaxID=2528026 RepID=A0A517ZFT4_9PLAN|nr:DUF962 domain-containing protein [Maioricimonas rarisocia]QDU41353.1 hypothetical protein Mal4_57190 [Maioricimonas rarisocia]
MLRRFLVNYYERHQHPANQLLHLIGLPVTFVVPVILLVEGYYLWAALSFVAGYALQFAGHAIEGNDAGEAILVKKLLGKPYVAVVPRPNESSRDD